MDYSILYTSYIPIVNGLINGDVDAKAKTWGDLVNWVFAMNSDSQMFSIEALARTFNYANKPTHFCIGYDILEIYVGHKDNRNSFLQEHQLRENIDYIEEDSEVRFTFHAFRRMIFMNADFNLVVEFEFVDKVYQLYVRYLKKMIARNKINTHWTIIEKVRNIPVNILNMCVKKKGFAPMNAQPRMFYILKGSSKSIRQKLLNDLRKTAEERQFDTEPLFPIYEAALDTAEDDIDMFQRYLIDTHITPYRTAQLGEEIKKINKTKLHIKVLKRAILIDPSQEDYTPEMLVMHIQELRLRIKKGYHIQSFDTETSGNTTCIDIFKATNGQYFDEFNMMDLNPSFDDISLIHTDATQSYMPSTNKVQFSEAEEDPDDDKTDAELKPKKRTPRARASTTDTLTSIEDDEDDVKPSFTEEETKTEPFVTKRTRAKSVTFAETVEESDDEQTKGRSRSKSDSHTLSNSSDEEGYSSSEY